MPNTEPIFVQAANITAVTFVNADGTTPKTVFTAGADGSVLRAINAATDDTANNDYDVWIRLASVDYRLGTFALDIGQGVTLDTNAANLLDPVAIPCLNDDGELFLPSGATVKVGPKAAVTAAKTAYIVAVGADF